MLLPEPFLYEKRISREILKFRGLFAKNVPCKLSNNGHMTNLSIDQHILINKKFIKITSININEKDSFQ